MFCGHVDALLWSPAAGQAAVALQESHWYAHIPWWCWQPLTEHSKTFLFLRDLPGDFGWGSSQRTPWQANWAFLRTALLCKALLLTHPFIFLSFTQAQACILVWWLSKSLSSRFLSQPFRLINLYCFIPL